MKIYVLTLMSKSVRNRRYILCFRNRRYILLLNLLSAIRIINKLRKKNYEENNIYVGHGFESLQVHLTQRSLAAFLYPSFISFVSAFESQFPIWFFFFLKRKKRKKKERKLQWSTGLSVLARITFLTPPKKKKKKK